MKSITANEALALDITETTLNVEFKEIRIIGEYSATVGVDRATPTFETLLKPFIDMSNGLQVEFNPSITLMRSSYGTEGTIYSISMPFGVTSLGGRETECRITRYGSFNSSSSDRFGLGMKVLVCSNGMMGWRNRGKAVTRFTANWDVISTVRVEQALQSFDGLKAHYVELANKLDSNQLTASQVDERLNQLIKGESKRSDNMREQVRELFVSGKGNRGQTSWDLFNAITEFENHHKVYRETSGVSSAENRLKGVLAIDTDSLAELVA